MTTKGKIAVMQAYEDGKTIQIRNRIEKNEWKDYKGGEPLWNWAMSDYRVKPESKLRPYKDATEFLQAQKEHGLYVEIEQDRYVIPVIVWNIGVQFIGCGKTAKMYEELIDKKWADGTPCGVMEE